MTTNAASLDERLSAHPQLKERIEAVLAIVEGSPTAVAQADEAERRVIAEMRRLGNEALRSWAAQQEQAQSAAVSQHGGVRSGKKNSTGIRRLGQSPWTSSSIGRRER
jgi:hypothetical protein